MGAQFNRQPHYNNHTARASDDKRLGGQMSRARSWQVPQWTRGGVSTGVVDRE